MSRLGGSQDQCFLCVGCVSVLSYRIVSFFATLQTPSAGPVLSSDSTNYWTIGGSF